MHCSSFFLCLQGQLSCVVATIFSSLAFRSSSVSMANMSPLVAASFSSRALLSSSISTANLSCLLATSLIFLSDSFSSPRFNLLRVAGAASLRLLFLTTFSFHLVVFLFYFLLNIFRVISSVFLSSVLQSLELCLL